MKTLLIALLLVSTGAIAGTLGEAFSGGFSGFGADNDRSHERYEEREYRRQQQEAQERQHREHMRQLERQRMYPGGSLTPIPRYYGN